MLLPFISEGDTMISYSPCPVCECKPDNLGNEQEIWSHYCFIYGGRLWWQKQGPKIAVAASPELFSSSYISPPVQRLELV